MTGTEVILFVLFALLGYWVVSFFLQRRSRQAWPRILNVDANASIDEIKAAHQALLRQCDPDQAKEITAAYQEAMRSRGVSA